MQYSRPTICRAEGADLSISSILYQRICQNIILSNGPIQTLEALETYSVSFKVTIGVSTLRNRHERYLGTCRWAAVPL